LSTKDDPGALKPKVDSVESTLFALVDQVPEAIVVTDSFGRIDWLNAAARDLFKDQEGCLVGEFVEILVPEQSRSYHATLHREAIREGRQGHSRKLGSGPTTLAGRRLDGTTFPAEIGLFTFSIASDSHTVALIRDVTDEHAAADEIARLVESLQSRDRILQAVVYTAERLLAGQWEEELDEILAKLGTAAQVSRARILRMHDGPDGNPLVSLTNEWNSEGFALSDGASLMDLPFLDLGYARWYERMLAHDAIYGLVRELPDIERPLLEAQGVVALAEVPIFAGGKPWGLLGFDECSREREWSIAEIDALRAAAEILGAAIERERIEARLTKAQRTMAETATLFETLQANAPVGFGFVDHSFRIVLMNDTLASMAGASADQLIGRSGAEAVPDLWPTIEPLHREVLETGVAVLNVELERAPRDEGGKSSSSLASYYPVRIGEEIIGLGIVVVDITERKEAERARDELTHAAVTAIGLVVEARDPYTAGHQQRVGEIAAAIAVELGLDTRTVEGIKLAGEIHDIGKIGVPAEILSRPGALQPAEFELVKSHSRAGFQILADIPFPWPIAQMILQHHERYDGAGYPQGLAGEEVLLGARIIHVADVVEAMSSHRPYRPARGIEAGLEEVERGSGSQFDPAVADACLRLFRQGRLHFQGWGSPS
jgi:PAS domain S-box-containing protein